MDTEIEKIAKAARLGINIREDSWNDITKEYEIEDAYDAFVKALESLNMDVRYARLIDLANCWSNDLDETIGRMISMIGVKRFFSLPKSNKEK